MKVDVDFIVANGGIGDCGLSAFDFDGKLVPSELDKRVYKLPWECFGSAARTRGKRVILMGQGREKAEPIYALLKAGWCNSLITDEPTAKEILKLAGRQVG